MNSKFPCTVTTTACSLLLLGTAISSWACGQNSLVITNLPTNAGAGFQVNDMNSAGQMTGLFYPAGQPGPHPFLYSGGVVLDLGGLGGASSQGLVLNALGQVAGEADTADGMETHAVLFGNGQVLDLGTLGGMYSSPTALNNAGQVAGFSLTAENATLEGFLYANGAMSSLGTLGGDYSWPTALNNAGVVAGEAALVNGDIHAFVFSGGTMLDLGTLGGTYSTASALNDSEVVVGQSTLANGETHAFLYSGGTLRDLGTLGGTASSAVAINAAGQIIGTATTASGQTHGFIYSNDTLTDLGTFAGECTPTAINKLGQVVGRSATTNGGYHAFLWQNGTLLDLNTLLPADSGWELLTAEFISDHGRVVGSGIHNNTSDYFILDLLPANTAPVAVAGPDQTVDCQAEVVLQGTQSHDPDGDMLAYEWSLAGSVLSTNPVFSAYFPLGTNVVTLKVTDPCGVSAETNVIVRVTDSTAPTLTCPAVLSAEADSTCQAAVPNVLAQAAASDNCTTADSMVIVQSPLPGALLGLGEHPIALTAVDASGNTTTSNVLFKVLDTAAPVIVSAPAQLTLSADANCQATVPDVLANVVATDNCTPAGLLVLGQNPAPGTLLARGQSSITVTVGDASGNSASKNIPVTVADTTAPVIQSLPAQLTLAVDANCQATVPDVLANVVATDNCTPAGLLVLGQNPAPGTLLVRGQSSITVTVTDASGNTSSRSISVAVADTTAPVIQSAGATPNVLSPPNHEMLPITVCVQASDNCDPAPTAKIVSVTCNETVYPGEIQITGNLTARLAATRDGAGRGRIYTLWLACTDASGNTSTTSVTVTVPQGNSYGGTDIVTNLSKPKPKKTRK